MVRPKMNCADVRHMDTIDWVAGGS